MRIGVVEGVLTGRDEHSSSSCDGPLARPSDTGDVDVGAVAGLVVQRCVPVTIGVETTAISPLTATLGNSDFPTLCDPLRPVADRTGTNEIFINDPPHPWRLATPT